MKTYTTNEFIKNNLYNSFTCAESHSLYLHSHDFYEIVYIYDGCGKHYINGKSETLKEGDFLIISPGIEHSIFSDANSPNHWIRICNCIFTKDYFNKITSDFLKMPNVNESDFAKLLKYNSEFYVHLSDNSFQIIKNYIFSMNYEFNKNENCIDYIIQSQLRNFMIETSRMYDIYTGRVKPQSNHHVDINNLIKYINSNLNLKLTLKLLAAQIHLSPDYLSRYFKKSTGKNITKYITELRIEKAKKLLIYTTYSIIDICSMCGYYSISNFRKYFVELVGQSPREYRKKYTQNSNNLSTL